MDAVKNYIKLSVRAERHLDDATSIPRPSYRIKDGCASYVTSWTFPCGDGSESEEWALGAAQDKRRALRAVYPHLSRDAFQLASWVRLTWVTGVSVIGRPVRSLALVDFERELSEAVGT